MARKHRDTILVVGLFCILPFLGIILINRPLPSPFTFPPLLTDPGDASFSWLVFGPLAFLITSTLAPFILRMYQHRPLTVFSKPRKPSFPWWGWAALLWIVCGWLLAWTRMPWMTNLQSHTFPLLWFGYIVFLNAVSYVRSGSCLLLNHTSRFLKLFPLSAGFWWIFEYLNQFVNNWHYVNLPEMSPLQGFLLTSLSFSTVLPAVLSTTEWLQSFKGLTIPFQQWYPIPQVTSPSTGWGFLILGSAGLLTVGIWPTILFPALWLSPLLVLLGFKIRKGKPAFLDGLAQGNWQPIVLPALAALFCGFWWECWNTFSLTHWEYTIPFVHGFQLFEMPLLGYAGYLSFGLECAAIVEWWELWPGSLARGMEGISNESPTESAIPKNPR